ncbi:MAG: hypothetical protein ABL890_01665 [Candidatus Peribacteraceae bacterium]
MKRLLSSTALALSLFLLSGCGETKTMRYRATWEDPARASVLIESIERVIVRRLAAMNFMDPAVTVVPENQTSAIVTVKATTSEMQDAVTHIMTDPFSFEMKLETLQAEDWAASEWESTGVDGSNLLWVQALGNKQTMEISMDLEFNDQGKKILEELARTKQGKRLGIFVRDILVSMLTIQSGSFADHVLIGGIPSTTIAEVFADDVNVGTRVSFTPF